MASSSSEFDSEGHRVRAGHKRVSVPGAEVGLISPKRNRPSAALSGADAWAALQSCPEFLAHLEELVRTAALERVKDFADVLLASPSFDKLLAARLKKHGLPPAPPLAAAAPPPAPPPAAAPPLAPPPALPMPLAIPREEPAAEEDETGQDAEQDARAVCAGLDRRLQAYREFVAENVDPVSNLPRGGASITQLLKARGYGHFEYHTCRRISQLFTQYAVAGVPDCVAAFRPRRLKELMFLAWTFDQLQSDLAARRSFCELIRTREDLVESGIMTEADLSFPSNAPKGKPRDKVLELLRKRRLHRPHAPLPPAPAPPIPPPPPPLAPPSSPLPRVPPPPPVAASPSREADAGVLSALLAGPPGEDPLAVARLRLALGAHPPLVTALLLYDAAKEATHPPLVEALRAVRLDAERLWQDHVHHGEAVLMLEARPDAGGALRPSIEVLREARDRAHHRWLTLYDVREAARRAAGAAAPKAVRDELYALEWRLQA